MPTSKPSTSRSASGRANPILAAGSRSGEHRQRPLLLALLLFFEVGGQRGRLLVEPLDLLEEGLDHLVFPDVADGHAPLEDDPLARAGGDSQVGLLGLAEAVDQA